MPKSGVGAVFGGGRFDNLVKDMGGSDFGCVGMAFGLDHLAVAMFDKKMYPSVLVPKVLVATFKKNTKEMLNLVAKLRKSGINTDFCADFQESGKLFDYAVSRNFCGIVIDGAYVVIQEYPKLAEQVRECLKK